MPGMPDSGRLLILIAGAAGVIGVSLVLLGAGVPPLLATMGPMAAGMYAWFRWERPHELRAERREKGLCVRRGYDLRGNVSGVSPECGEVAA
jgi:hypothetical protein